MLEQIYLWLKSKPAAPQLSAFMQNMEKEGMKVVLCPEKDRDISAMQDEIPAVFCRNAKNSLLVTDRTLSVDVTERFPIAGYGFSYRGKVKYILGSLEGISAGDMRLIYARCARLPYAVAETERLVIREMAVNDLTAMYDLYASLKDCLYVEPLYEREQETEFIQNYIRDMYGFYQYGLWLLWDKASGRLAGRAGIENRMIDGVLCRELGYLIRKDMQRQGYGYEASRAIIRYAFETLELDELYLCADKRNIPSIALGQKLGFSLYAPDVDGMHIYKMQNYRSNA